ncbi:hypothetical protein AGMMS50230_01040 [Spirochaetia bacterium]|nr:hypothetical protein AGMMS50230_01040 [Spirochaetia bacterium]
MIKICQKTAWIVSFLFFCTLVSCKGTFLNPIKLTVDYTAMPGPEQALLTSVLAKVNKDFAVTDKPGPGIITVTYEGRFTTWAKTETPPPADFPNSVFIPLSQICMVPRAKVSEGKVSVGSSTLVPLEDVAPPYLALKVDGLDVSDPDYPLVYQSGFRFSYEGPPHTKRAVKKINALAALLKEVSAGAFHQTERPRLFRIAAGGDAMLARGVEEILFTEGIEAVLGGTAALVRDADISMVNLEGAVTSRGEAAKKTYTFRFDPRTAAALKDAGFNAVLLANNHAFDYGLTGFFDSLDHLEKAGLAVLGAGRDIQTAAHPFVSAASGPGNPTVRVFGIANYGPERNGWDGLDFAADEKTPGLLHAGNRGAEMIKAQLAGDDTLNVIFFHGGVEYADYPSQETRALYTELIRAGADLVIGTHPHVEQGFEWVEGKPVFWSLGDYVFDEMDDTPGGDKGLFIVLSYIGDRLVYLDPYPLFMKGPRTVIAPAAQLDRFFRLTKDLEK